MGILGWIILGLVAGAIAKARPSRQEPRRLLGTLMVGISAPRRRSDRLRGREVRRPRQLLQPRDLARRVGGALLLLVIYSTLAAGGEPLWRT